MVRDPHGPIALASAHYAAGWLARFQADRILVDGAVPGELDGLGLERYSVSIDMDTVRALELHPPLLLLRYAEAIDSGSR